MGKVEFYTNERRKKNGDSSLYGKFTRIPFCKFMTS